MDYDEIPIEPGGPSWGDVADRVRAERVSVPADIEDPPVFSTGWARRTAGRMLGLDRWARDWSESTVLLSPTASHYLPGTEQPVPPVSHLEAIQASLSARQSALHRILDDVEQWRALRVYGATEAGYAAPHTALYVSEDVRKDRFEPWVSAHTTACPLADDDAHGDGAVSIETAPNESEPTGIVNYMMKNVPGCDTTGSQDHGIADASRSRVRTAAVLDRAGVAPVRFGRTAGQD